MAYENKLVLIDGHSILNRAFYGMPDLTSSAGLHTGAVYGFLKILFKILDEEKPQYLTVAFDVHAPTFRHEAYADYKGTRHLMPDELREQVPLIKKVLKAMGVATCEKAGLEADDILGTLAKKAQASGIEVSLVSGDRDLLQIADEHIQIRIPKTQKGQTTILNYYAKDVEEALGVTPLEFIQVKALQGDTADNIPGVPKVGPKTATDLIIKYHSVDGVYEHLSEITRKSLHDNLEQNEDQARLSLFLATIKADAPVELDPEVARLGNLFTPEAFGLYTELGFKNLLTKFSRETAAAAQSAPGRASAATAQNAGQQKVGSADSEWKELSEAELREELPEMFLQDLPDARIDENNENEGRQGISAADDSGDLPWAAVFPLMDPPAPGGVPEGLAVSALAVFENGQAEVLPAKEGDGGNELVVSAAGELVPAGNKPDTTELTRRLTDLRVRARNGELRLAVFNLKAQLPLWDIPREEFRDGICLDGIMDVLLGAYLLNPLKNDYEPEDIAAEYLGETVEGREHLLGKNTMGAFYHENPKEAAAYAERTCRMLAKAAPLVRDALIKAHMLELYERVELPLSYVLYDMQRIGIRVLPDKLSEYGEQLVGRIHELEEAIYEAAGHDFNIASPKQLGKVLFEELQLPGGKKTKSGYSTAADVLEKLSPEHDIVAKVLEYRGLTKLKSTYADGLAGYIAEDERIHTTFHQTITATGRISSADPNLQNIPMRTELGRAIRKVFVPGEGCCFTDADYSQIELRILASMSGDEALIEAYRENRDIHRATAAKVFHTPYEEVTPLQRRNAKAVNFGIVYGISSFGLSQNLSVSRAEAKEYIEAYFQMFPGIKAFLDQEVKDARECGYSTTLFGRRRPVPELKSSNFMQRQFGERVAMNAPIQGTGADIMKVAMLRVWEELCRRGLQSRIILQIHDELLIETAQGEEEQVAQILKNGMMGAASLRVPLEIDCHTGTDWYETK